MLDIDGTPLLALLSILTKLRTLYVLSRLDLADELLDVDIVALLTDWYAGTGDLADFDGCHRTSWMLRFGEANLSLLAEDRLLLSCLHSTSLFSLMHRAFVLGTIVQDFNDR